MLRVSGSMVNIPCSRSTLHSWWEKRIAGPIDKFVKHVYREHNQEADHWANIGAQGQRKIVIDTR